MKTKNQKSFFIKLKNAIFNFDEYPNFAEEKLGTSVKYILKLMLLFSLIFSIVITLKFIKETKVIANSFKEIVPNFKLENNTLIMEEAKFEKVVGNENLKIIIDAENEEFAEENNYYRTMVFLKDKISLIVNNDVVSNISYKEITTKFNLETITKDDIINFINR